MKKYYILIIYLFLLISCKGFLDKGTLERPTTNNYYSTQAQVYGYVNGLYTYLPSYGSFGIGVLGVDVNSDNIISIQYDKRLNGELKPNDEETEWRTLYERIRACNEIISNYRIPKASENEYDRSLLGEAYFFRAWWYFNGLRSFANLTIIKNNIDDKATYKSLQLPQSDRSDVCDFILSDLDKAESLLLNRDVFKGLRVNKEAAMALYTNVATYEGSWEYYHKNDAFAAKVDRSKEFLEKAVKKAEALMKMQTVSLYTIKGDKKAEAYAKLFNSTDLSDMSEVLLWRMYSAEKGVNNELARYLAAGYCGSQPSGITSSLVNEYLNVDASFPDIKSPDYKKFNNTFKNRDPRLLQTVMNEGSMFRDTTKGLSRPIHLQKYRELADRNEVYTPSISALPRKEQLKDPKVAKYYRDSLANVRISLPTLTGYNITGYNIKLAIDPTFVEGYSQTAMPILRYAEVLLNYAEASAILNNGNLSDEILDKTLKPLQERAGLTYHKPDKLDPNYPDCGYKISPIMQAIRRERRCEFALQGKRLDDLMRWAAADIFMHKRGKGVWLAPESLFWQSYSPAVQKLLSDKLIFDSNMYLDPLAKLLPNGYNFNKDRDYLKPIPQTQLAVQKTLKQNPGW